MKKKVVTVALTTAMIVSTLSGCDMSNENTSTELVSNLAESDKAVSEATKNVDSEELYMETTELSTDLFSWQISIDGVVYTLPCEFSEFEKNGWELFVEEEHEDDGIMGTNCHGSIEMKKGEDRITVWLQNTTDEDLEYSKCPVVEVELFLEKIKSDMEVVFPKNLVASKDITKEEVIEKYGEPAEEIEAVEKDPTCALFYQHEDNDYKTRKYKDWAILFTEEGRDVLKIVYRNFN